MRLSEADLKHLWDMLDAARRAHAFVSGRTRESFLADEVLCLAIERLVAIIGESARRVSDEGRAHLALQWGAIVATRHILAHEYDEVDREQVWRIVTLYPPRLIEVVGPVLEANPPGPEAAKDPGEP